MLSLLFSNPAFFVLIFGGIIIAIGIHEAAHAYMADYLGDPTPRSLGRTTLNPLAHLDPYGTLVILVTGLFGWGKPAPYDPYNLKNPQKDTALIALAGPVSNLILATILSLLFRVFSFPSAINYLLITIISLNINLALFNLLPVSPLDGSKIIGLFTPSAPISRLRNQDNLLLLLLLILPVFGGNSIASIIISPISQFLLDVLI